MKNQNALSSIAHEIRLLVASSNDNTSISEVTPRDGSYLDKLSSQSTAPHAVEPWIASDEDQLGSRQKKRLFNGDSFTLD